MDEPQIDPILMKVVTLVMILTGGYTYYETRRLLRVPIARDVIAFVVGNLVAGAAAGVVLAFGRIVPTIRRKRSGEE